MQDNAWKSIGQACRKAQTATPETVDSIKASLKETLEQQLQYAGDGGAQKMRDEVDKAAKQADDMVEQIKKRREAVEEKKREQEVHRLEAVRLAEERKKEMEEKEKVAAERAEVLTLELAGLVAKTEEQMARLSQAAKPLGGLSDKAQAQAAAKEKKENDDPFDQEKTEADMSEDELVDAADTLVAAHKDSDCVAKDCTEWLVQKGQEMKTLVAKHKKAEAPEINKSLSKLFAHIQELAGNSKTALGKAKLVKDKITKKKAAQDKAAVIDRLFKKYDKDRDGELSQKEVQTYAKTEFKFQVTPQVMDTIWKAAVPAGMKGVAFADFLTLKLQIGIAREVMRDNTRKAVALEKIQVLEKVREGLNDKLEKLNARFEDLAKPLVDLEKNPLAKQAKGLTSVEMVDLAVQYEEKTQGVRENAEALIGRMSDLSKGVEERFKKDADQFVAEQAKTLRCKIGRMEGRLRRARVLSVKFKQSAEQRKGKEVEKKRFAARRLIKHNLRLKGVEGFFGTSVDEQEFLQFFTNADTEVRLKDEREAEKAAAPDAEEKKSEGEAKEAEGEKPEDADKAETTEEAKGDEEKPSDEAAMDETGDETETVQVSQEEAALIFQALLQETRNGEEDVPGFIPRDTLLDRIAGVA